MLWRKIRLKIYRILNNQADNINDVLVLGKIYEFIVSNATLLKLCGLEIKIYCPLFYINPFTIHLIFNTLGSKRCNMSISKTCLCNKQ